jgi:hypothetical protein
MVRVKGHIASFFSSRRRRILYFMDIRVECPCGQAYAFGVEPVNNAMPCPVACPVCGTDGTALANQYIRTILGAQIPVPPPAPPAPSGLRINRPPPSQVAEPPTPPPITAPPVPATSRFAGAAVVSRAQAVPGTNNLLLGIVGAILGASLGAGIMFGLSAWAGFKFPLFGTCIGLLTGLGARILYKGTDSQLGIMAALIGLLTTIGTLYILMGDMAILGIVSMVVSAAMAYRIAS